MNISGNQKMNSKIIGEKKAQLHLTKRQREIIVGLLLGDGHLETQNGGRTYRLKVEHGVAQRAYVDWLYAELQPWIRSRPYVREHGSFGKKIISCGFTTYSSGALRFYGQQFYDGKKKIMPRIIGKLLTPLAIAIWFMDDGSKKSNEHKTYIIHALGYAKEELDEVRKIFENKFNIAVRIHRQYERWRIYIASESAEEFRNTIQQFIIPSMRYKLGEQMPKK